MRAFATADLPSPAAVVIHDAGAANIILAWIDAGMVPGDRVYAEGPAAKLWDSKRRPWPRLTTLADALNGAASVLSGTGWASSLEHDARCAARARGLPSVAVIDHWVNYQSRFTREGIQQLPDKICVTDTYAEEIARATFPDLAIRQLPNLYLEAEIASIRAKRGGDKPRDLLYVLEPARDSWGTHIPGEFQALDYLVENWEKLGLSNDAKLRLRPHPSEKWDKYDEWIARHDSFPVERDATVRLSDAIANAGTVAGCNSFAMVIALTAGLTVVCTLPPWAPACVLPHDGLIHLKDLV